MSKTYSAGIVTAYGAAKRAGYTGTYEDFCRQQAGYAESAAAVEQAKNTAVSAANTATTKAGEASTAATAAQTAKTQTEAAASQALTDISTARSGAISAVQTEGQTQTANARTQAQAAAASATTASTKASEASASATSAGQSATNAAASATSAANAASAAQGVLDSIPDDYSDLSEDVDQLKADLAQQTEKIDAIGDMDDYSIHVTDWTMGRRSTGASNNYYYSSNDIIPMPSQLYFDDANYKISYVQCNADGTESIGYGSSWKTTSPATLSKTGSYDYCWIEIQHTTAQTSITDSELEEVKTNTYHIAPIPIVETIKQALTSAYVDGVNGLDTNDGSSVHPYKTIGKAVASGRNTIFVKNGTYNEFVFIQNREKLTILPWAYGLSFDTTVPDTPKIEITGGACAIRAYDCGELKFVGIYGHDTTLSAFELLRNKSVEMTNCWASDVDDPEWNGFKISCCNGVFRNCQAWNIGRDGFGISIYGNTQFIDCVAHDCGDDGVSHHDGCTGAVIGGEYYNCAKGGVASPTYGSYIDVINVYSHDNKYGLYSVTDSTRRRSKARVSGCVFKNNTDKDIYINNNDIIGWNNIYDNKSLINQATFTEF